MLKGRVILVKNSQTYNVPIDEIMSNGINYTTKSNNRESLEYWLKLYWGSLKTFDECKAKKPYPKPEVLVFEPVPKEII